MAAPYNRRVRARQFNSLVQLTVREFVRSHFARAVLGVVALAWGLAAFGASLAITESAEFRIAFYAAAVRLGLVATTALVVVQNVVREIDDGLRDLLLSRPLARRTWLAGKFAGGALATTLAAALAGLPLFAWCAPAAAAAWTGALAGELVLVGAAALTAAVSLGHFAFASLAVGGFYVLCRSLQALVWLAEDPLLAGVSPFAEAAGSVLRGLHVLLPDLARFAPSAWLLRAAPDAAELAFVAIETVLFAAVLVVIGMVDCERRAA